MARPIPFEAPPRDPKVELLHRLERAPADHAAALLDAYDLLQKLHDRGMIDTLRGFVGSADQVLDIAVEESLKRNAIHAMRNALLLYNALSSIAPETLTKFTKPIPLAIQVAAGESRPPSLWKLMKQSIFNRDFRRGLSASLGIIRAIGHGLNNPDESK